MKKVGSGGKSALKIVAGISCMSISICGVAAVTTSANTGTATRGTITRATTTQTAQQIKGSAATSAMVGVAYSFQPTAVGTKGTPKFSIVNRPSWARFDTATGKLAGTPSSSQAGSYAAIRISVASSSGSASLPAFKIVVADNPRDNVTLSWQAPTENVDRSPLVDLKGYMVHYGAKSKAYSATIQVANPGLTTFVVQNLAPGKYYFAVTAYNRTGQESSLSPEVVTQVN